MAQIKKYDGLEIAIIGISAQFPQSRDYREFWQNLCEGRELVRTFTDEELRQSGVPENLVGDSRYVRTLGVLEDKDRFDPGFFGYTLDEAAVMDPQIRLLHEHCWHALEDAGYAASPEKNRIGLYAGASNNDNWKIYVHTMAADHPSVDPFYLRMLIDPRFCSTLVSYKLNLRGPSIFLDTACSTSLTAVHLAARALLTRDCTIALAGGVCLKTLKRKGYLYEEGMVSSADGHCRTFDARASGTGSGEGAGIVVLKRLTDAIKDKDHIYAVLRSTAANNDGSEKVGFTAPGVKGQADCIRSAIKLAGVDPNTIGYVEAHGTATRLGDPIEIRALTEAFDAKGSPGSCAIGSVKSNMGHADAAAGVAGLIKTVLCLYHKQIPPSINFSEPNPEIDFGKSPFYVNTTCRRWVNLDHIPLRAGVSSLGMGGTNVHVILEEAPTPKQPDHSRPESRTGYHWLTVSGRTEGAVARYLEKLKTFLAAQPDIDPADIAFTLQTGRKHFSWRMALAYSDREELTELLNATRLRELIVKARENASAVFMFPGAGFQYPGMGRDLYVSEPVFRAEMRRGFDVLKNLIGEDYEAILYPADPADKRIYAMQHTQPIIFLFEYALARLIMSYGISPARMIGHSVGEYVAACLAGVFHFEDALTLVVRRGILMHTLPHGAMLSAQLTEQDAQRLLTDEIGLAAINGPEQVVLSGNADAIDSLADRLESHGVSCSRLQVSHAAHSYMMDSILEPYNDTLQHTRMAAPTTPVISALTGQLLTKEQSTSPRYWVDHLRQTVRFSDGIATLLRETDEMIFLDMGAGSTLSTIVRQRKTQTGYLAAVSLVRHAKEPGNDNRYLADRIAQVWAQGIDPDWDTFYKDWNRTRIPLPGYSFEPAKFPTEIDVFANGLPRDFNLASPLFGQKVTDWLYYPSWKRQILSSTSSQIEDRTFLLFTPGGILFQHLKQRLAEKGHHVVEVMTGDSFRQISGETFVADPTRAEHFQQLIGSLHAKQIGITDIIYGWAADVAPADIQLQQDNPGINLAYLSIVHLVQASLKTPGWRPPRMTFLTRCLYNVTGSEEGGYAQALLTGLVKDIPQELAIPCCHIDIGTDEEIPRIVDMVMKELYCNGGRQDRIVAHRDGQRWLMDFQKITDPAAPATGRIRKNGTYLITGGLGNIGFTLAGYLLEKYDARLILTGRKHIPDLSERLSHLQGLSTRIAYHAIDVADTPALRRLVDEVENETGPIDGVIHAAGITDNSYFELIENSTPQKALEMFAAKVAGIESLYRIFKDRSPDFVWVTSSLASLLGGMGYCSYASANAYMDQLILAKTTELPAWKCMVLGEVVFDKKAVERESSGRRTALMANELPELLEWSLADQDSPILLQSTEDLTIRMQRSNQVKQMPVQDQETGQVIGNRLDRSALSSYYEEPVTMTEKKLHQLFESFFGMEGIGVEDHFLEIGGDSLKGMLLLKRINQEFSLNLPLKDLLLHPSIRQMSARVDDSLQVGADAILENEISL